ncbi:MAG: bifunctional oligoribonuclease/PAP phosphatase NrnA [Gemmatimonadota bacterium]|nr:bifunctional oligoribonuclease/PAP phosphatase NrnA [Gemmatimonadota bacterium]
MSYRTPPERVPAVMEARNALLASRRAVLTTHLNADGDGTGCQGAIASWLRANGTEAWIINPTPFPDQFRFLIESESWIVPAGSAKARDLCADADLAVVLDTGEVPRIGRVRDLIRDLPTLVLDHHPPGERAIGGTSLRDADACATGELVYDVISKAGGPWTDHVTLGIYVAILTDTGGFRYTNATPDSHHIAADLIARGVNPEAIYDRIYGSATIRKFRLLRDSLDTLESDPEAGVSWMTVPTESYERIGATPEDLEGLVDVPRTLEGTQVALLFRGTAAGEIKVSFRSTGEVDVNALARHWEGGGHTKASGAMLPGPMERAVAEVLSVTREVVSGDAAEQKA